jgi:hypothetical protein
MSFRAHVVQTCIHLTAAFGVGATAHGGQGPVLVRLVFIFAVDDFT